MVKHSKICHLFGPIFSEIFETNRVIPAGCDIIVRFTQSKPAFCLMAEAGAPKVKLTNASLFVKHLKCDNEVLQSLEEVALKTPFTLPINRVVMKCFNISSSMYTKTFTNIYSGQKPGRICVGLILNKALVGDFKESPFKFSNFSLKHIFLTVNNKKVPANGYNMDYEKDNFAQAYLSSFNALHIYRKNKSHGVSMEMFKKGYAVYFFDITNDDTFGLGGWSPKEVANISLHLEFDTALQNPVSVICMAEYETQININNHREVSFD
jgi:hypothetical protein